MDIAPSGIADNNLLDVYIKLINLGRLYIENLKSVISDVSTTDEIAYMIDDIINIFKKFKTVYSYSLYSVTHKDIRNINHLIKEFEEFPCNFSVLKPTFKKSKFCTRNALESLGIIYDDIKKCVMHYVNIYDRNLIFTDLSWPKNNVLVGTLRNPNQLNCAIRHSFYHIPKTLVNDADCLRYVAIYQSKRFFPIDSGIRYYGKIIKYSEVERYKIREIPSESKEFYYKFYIDEWKLLKSPVAAHSFSDVCMYTNLYMLFHSDKTSELNICTKSEYELYEFMKKYAFTPFCAFLHFMQGTITYNGSCFEISKYNKKVLKITNENFIKNGAAMVKTISNILGSN